jgi:hypothetical protein
VGGEGEVGERGRSGGRGGERERRGKRGMADTDKFSQNKLDFLIYVIRRKKCRKQICKEQEEQKPFCHSLCKKDGGKGKVSPRWRVCNPPPYSHHLSQVV